MVTVADGVAGWDGASSLLFGACKEGAGEQKEKTQVVSNPGNGEAACWGDAMWLVSKEVKSQCLLSQKASDSGACKVSIMVIRTCWEWCRLRPVNIT
jgi:hypothetical protein